MCVSGFDFVYCGVIFALRFELLKGLSVLTVWVVGLYLYYGLFLILCFADWFVFEVIWCLTLFAGLFIWVIDFVVYE